MIKIEVLFPEICNLFGDNGNVKYLKACIPDAEIINTALTDTPYFVENEPSLIYMGPMSERAQEMVIEKLFPYKERIQTLIDKGVPMLFTGNACEIFANYIKTPEGEKIDGLGILDFYAERQKIQRYNGFVLGHFKGIEMVGFKSQFTYGYGNNSENCFVKTTRGIGLGKDSDCEGFCINNMIATYLLGPLLVINPDFTRYLLDKMGAEDSPLAFEKEVYNAFYARLAEFKNPKLDVE